MTSNVHVIGANGSIGKVLLKSLETSKFNVFSYTHNENESEKHIIYDITSDDSEAIKLSENLDIVIILSSNTNVDDCAKYPATSNSINMLGPIRLLKYLSAKNVKVIYFSSDAVFGDGKESFVEEDDAEPLTVYGQQKVVCEEFVKQNFSDYLVLRMSKVIGPYSENFLMHQIKALKNDQVIPCFTDQWVSPVFVNDIADFIIKAINLKLVGTYHLAADDHLTRYEMGVQIAAALDVPIEYVQKTSLNDVEMFEPRSKYSCLSNEKAKHDASMKFSSYSEMVKKCISY